MNIDSVGPETVDDYYERGLIRDAADLYRLTVEQLMGNDGTRRRSAEKVIAGIRRSLDVPFERVLFALGIRFVGKVVAKTLARRFGSLDALRAASLDDLMQTEGVGQAIAESVLRYFADERNLAFVARLAEAGVRMEAEQAALQSTALEGMSIVISGTFARHSREEYKALIEAHGGKNVGSISKKTTFILAGENMGPSKLEKASKLGVPLKTEDEFLQMIEG